MTTNRPASALPRDQMAALLQTHAQALSAHDVSSLVALYTDDAIVTSPMFESVRGRTAIEESFGRLFALWPDYQLKLTDVLCLPDEQRAVTVGSVLATHGAELFGLPPTGEQIQYDSVRIYRFRDGLIADERRIYDLRGVLEGLRKARLERELGLAAVIQRLLLARTTHRNAFAEVAGASAPSRTVGGDFLEYNELPTGDLTVAIGDASGKGPAAALVAAMVQGILSVESDAARRPSETLARVNRALWSRQLEPHYVTLVYGVLSADGRFTYANAGHNAPVLMAGDGFRRLSTGGPPVGIFRDAAFLEETVSLAPGDAVVAFTDGVTEAVNEAGEEFTDARVLASLSPCRRTTAQHMLDTLLESIRAFGGPVRQGDDMTALVIQRRPSS